MECRAKLNDKILYLLRLKAMQMGIVVRNNTCHNHKKLYDYLMNDPKAIESMEKGTSYFDSLMKEIGLTDDSKQDNPKYKISVLTLKRLYGRVRSASPASNTTLEYIADFITDSRYTWNELQERVKNLTEELEHDCLWQGSYPIRMEDMARPKDGTINKVYSSSLVKGDRLRLTFDSGRKLELYYKGESTYLVTSTESHILKIGYTMKISRMRCGGKIYTSEVYDRASAPTDGYESDRIKEIDFEGGPDAEWENAKAQLSNM